jgi:hypothetical protein
MYRTARMRRTTSLFIGMPKANVICCATFAPVSRVAVLVEASRGALPSATTPVVLADAGVENVNAQGRRTHRPGQRDDRAFFSASAFNRLFPPPKRGDARVGGSADAPNGLD